MLWPRSIWVIVAIVILVDLAWIATPYASLDSDGWSILVSVWASSGALILLAQKNAISQKLYTLVTGLAVTLSLWPSLKILNHLTMSIPFELADNQLSQWDKLFGFDWLSYIHFLDDYPKIISMMNLAYGGLINYCCIAFLAIIFIFDCKRAIEFVCLFVFSAFFTILSGVFFPAKGAMVFYSPPGDQFQFVKTNMGTYFWKPLESIRSSESVELVVTQLPGLVAFPSFHTAMGVIVIYAARGVIGIFAPALLVNVLMIASTPLFGGHYIVDVLAGIFTAVGTIVVYRIVYQAPVPGRELAAHAIHHKPEGSHVAASTI